VAVSNVDIYAQSKVNQCAWNVWQIWKNTTPAKATQLIFCDFSTPHPERHNVYRYLKDLFVKLGIPKYEVALIHDCKNDSDRSLLFQKVKSGQIRILIGSTEKLGTGVNVQDLLIAEHHLDAPWRPSDVEQRTGRTRRQGNKWSKVWSFKYVTEGTNSQSGFDSFSWQTLETKARFIAQISNGNVTSRTAEDINEAVLSFAQVKAMASGNPIIMEKAQLDAQYNALKIQRRGHDQRQSELFFQIGKTERKINELPKVIEAIAKDLELTKNMKNEPLVIGGEVFSNSFQADRLIKKLMNEFDNHISQEIGFIGQLTVVIAKSYGELRLLLRGSQSYILEKPKFVFIQEAIAKGIREMFDKETQRLVQARKDIIELKNTIGKPLEHLDKMIKIKGRLKKIELILSKEQDSKESQSFSLWTDCADYIPPESEIVEELQSNEDCPNWLLEIIDMMPSNILEFPIQKSMSKLEIIEYKFESVSTKKGAEIMQGCLF